MLGVVYLVESDTPIPVWRHSEMCWDKKTVEEHYDTGGRKTACRFLSKTEDKTQKHRIVIINSKFLDFYSVTSTVQVFLVLIIIGSLITLMCF